MLLTISTTGVPERQFPATDFGFLLGKHPDRLQTFEVTGGKAHVFYPEATAERCTIALLLDIDPIELVRTLRVPGNCLMLRHYVNDRPYVASSFTSVASAAVFSSALNGRCNTRPELVGVPLPLEVRISVLRANGGDEILRRVFEPLGYAVTATRHALDPHFPAWGESAYHDVTLTHPALTLRELLAHLYVLLPVFDNEKHYYVSQNDVEALLRKGEGWLSDHPEREWIVWRYLRRAKGLARQALNHLIEAEEETETPETDEAETSDEAGSAPEESAAPLARRVTLHQQRLRAVLDHLVASGATSVLDLGCGEGQLLRLLLAERQFSRITGMDVAYRELLRAKDRLRYGPEYSGPPGQQQRLTLLQGSLIYRDERLRGYDAAALVEVIEHIDPPRLHAFERVVFEFARPRIVVLTTPNAEYNVHFDGLANGKLRHKDHRFEWTRAQLNAWTHDVATRFGYTVRLLGIGEEDPITGPPTQMAIFERSDAEAR
ncbi:MAG: 3' terminal RNA ribose 2'-O-methyltransferase Hen1, partial [Sphingobacteriaceae bacterium]|nr:3' terminal RNA ribose 2'-O-methyltransferase Hen1 [Cytophagaceae bacterium]